MQWCDNAKRRIAISRSREEGNSAAPTPIQLSDVALDVLARADLDLTDAEAVRRRIGQGGYAAVINAAAPSHWVLRSQQKAGGQTFGDRKLEPQASSVTVRAKWTHN